MPDYSDRAAAELYILADEATKLPGLESIAMLGEIARTAFSQSIAAAALSDDTASVDYLAAHVYANEVEPQAVYDGYTRDSLIYRVNHTWSFKG